MKRFLALILAILMCGCLVACSDDGIPEGMVNASNTDIVDYNLYVPEDWLVQSPQRATSQAYVSDSDRTNVLVMQWNITENTKTIDDWWTKEYKPQVIDVGAFNAVKVISEGEECLLDKRPAKSYEYDAKLGDTVFKYKLVTCITKGSIYVIQFTYMQDVQKEGAPITFSTVEKHADSVKRIIDEFKFN